MVKITNTIISDEGTLIREGLDQLQYWFYIQINGNLCIFAYDSNNMVIYDEYEETVILDVYMKDIQVVLKDFTSVFFFANDDWCFLGKKKDGTYHAFNLYSVQGKILIEANPAFIGGTVDIDSISYHHTYFSPDNFWKVGPSAWGVSLVPKFGFRNKRKIKQFLSHG